MLKFWFKEVSCNYISKTQQNYISKTQQNFLLLQFQSVGKDKTGKLYKYYCRSKGTHNQL